MFPFVDKSLSARLELTEGAMGVSFAKLRARVAPEIGTTWATIGGAIAVYDGTASYLTQTFGLGMTEEATAQVLDAHEAFFFSRGAQTQHEVSPMAGVELFAALAARGYRPIEMTNVMVRSTSDDLPAARPNLVVRIAERGDAAAWIEASVKAWSETPGVEAHVRTMATLSFDNPESTNFAVEDGGELIATASLGMRDGIALLVGAATLPGHRGKGAQNALLATRLAHARAKGCDLAMMGTGAGSGSQRNAERNGFRVAYTRTKWARARE